MTITVQDNILRCFKKFGAKVASSDLHKRAKWQVRPQRERIAAPAVAQEPEAGKTL